MINWGVIGYGNIAKRFIKSLAHHQDGQLYALASRSGKGIQDLFQEYPDLHYYDHYQKLIEDENVDAIYIALPHADHFQWAKAALLHHKAVLCEKPATLSYQQTQTLCELSKQYQTFFMEAMKTRFIPLIEDIHAFLNEGMIGNILRIETSFCSQARYDENSYLYDKYQGGILYDCGIYNIAAILDYIDSPLLNIQGEYAFRYGVDAYDKVELTFASHQTALMECALDQYKERIMTIIGDKGKMIMEPFYRPWKVKVIFNDGKTFIHESPYIVDDFYGEIAEVHRCIKASLYESERMSHQDSLKAIQIIEKIKEQMYE